MFLVRKYEKHIVLFQDSYCWTDWLLTLNCCTSALKSSSQKCFYHRCKSSCLFHYWIVLNYIWTTPPWALFSSSLSSSSAADVANSHSQARPARLKEALQFPSVDQWDDRWMKWWWLKETGRSRRTWRSGRKKNKTNWNKLTVVSSSFLLEKN